MSKSVECPVRFQRARKGKRVICAGLAAQPFQESGCLPRITRLLALAIRFEGLIRAGTVADYADLARLGHVSRARITQIMNLRLLAPSIQEEILFLPRLQREPDPIQMRHLQPIAKAVDWRKQRRLWIRLKKDVEMTEKVP